MNARRARTRARQRRSLAVLAGFLVLVAAAGLGTMLTLGSARENAARSSAQSESGSPRAQQAAAKPTTSIERPKPKPKLKPKPSSEPASEPTSGVPQAVANAALPYPDPPSVTPRSYAQLTPRHRYIAITLDDGLPFDERILKLLEDNNIRCTTFLLGSVAKSRPDIIERLDKDGFEIANHTWDHTSLSSASDDEIRSQLSRTQRAISSITGNQAPYLRPPYGATDAHVREIAAEEGYKIVMWSRSFGDTGKHARPSLCYKNAIEGIKPGDIVLCHWGRPATYQAMVWFLRDLKKQNLTPVTVSELIADSKTTEKDGDDQ